MPLLLVCLVLAIAFVLVTGTSLPPEVACHFIAGGYANGFMPRDTYLCFTIALLVGLSLLIAFLASITLVLPIRFINFPNREYWLSPERQGDTLAYLHKHGTRFGILLADLHCFVHWLVVQTNEHSPPLFSESLLFIGMAIFLIGIVTWLRGFILHFRRRA